MIVLSESILLAPATNPLNTPIFGMDNRVIAANVSATTEELGFPATGVASPETYVRWKAEPDSPPEDQYLTILLNDVEEVDYLAVAVHNFGSGQIPVSVEGASEFVDSPGLEPDWQELVGDVILADDGPALFRFTPQSLIAIRLRMQPGLEAPTAAVVYVGKLLVCERGTHTDHVPINLARASRMTNAKSENGQFLGRIILSQGHQTTFSLNLLRDPWYRANMDPFVVSVQEVPFFFAWKPQEFPSDIGYCTLRNDPSPSRDFATGRFSVELQLAGVSVIST